MKRLSLPTSSAEVVFDACRADVNIQALFDRLGAGREDLLLRAEEYAEAAAQNQLHTFQHCEWGNEDQVIVPPLTKGDLTTLYSKHMVGKSSPGRSYYDRLIMSSAKCPYCGIGQTATLDHFLTKARYPAFSVLPINLVPSCFACNHGRKQKPLEAGDAHLHPYFENADIETTPWLYANIEQGPIATARFLAVAPANWPADKQQRVRNHFKEFGLANKFAIESVSELASVSDLLRTMSTDQIRTDHLNTIAGLERANRTNTWKAALYEAMSVSDWYREQGYLLRA